MHSRWRLQQVRSRARVAACTRVLAHNHAMPCLPRFGLPSWHPIHHRAVRRSMLGSEPHGSHALRALCTPVPNPCSPLLQIIIALEWQTCRKPRQLSSPIADPHRRSPSSSPFPLTVAFATTALVSPTAIAAPAATCPAVATSAFARNASIHCRRPRPRPRPRPRLRTLSPTLSSLSPSTTYPLLSVS